MRILVCDIHVRLEGHNLGYVQNILQYLETHVSPHEYIFLFNPSAKQIPSIKTTAPNCQIVFFTENEFAPYLSGESIKTATVKIWKSIENYALELKIDELLILQMDMFQHTIGLSKLPLPISGIMLTPLTRIAPADDSLAEKLKFQLRFLKKRLTTRLLLRNPNLKRIYLLNDVESVDKLNKRFDTQVFTYLPDPVYDYPFEATLDCREKYKIAVNRKIFLSFGMIDEKKNVINLINAAEKLSIEKQKDLCILIVGKVRETYAQPLEEAIRQAEKIAPDLQICQNQRFVTDAEMESYVMQCDIVSLAYINFYSSSGVIGLAARHNKPILATEMGVVGQQTRHYGLGLTADARDVDSLRITLEKLMTQLADYPVNAHGYVTDHSPQAFMKKLLY